MVIIIDYSPQIHNCELFLQAENTYLLTLDGDIDFKAESVTLLVDRMKKNKKVGAACGRIHPIGTGEYKWERTTPKPKHLTLLDIVSAQLLSVCRRPSVRKTHWSGVIT